MPGTHVGFILSIVQVYTEAPGKHENQEARAKVKIQSRLQTAKTWPVFD